MSLEKHNVYMCLFLSFTGFVHHVGLNRISRPVFFVVSPNVLKLNTKETVTLATFGNVDDVYMNLYLQDCPGLSKNYSFKQVFVPRDEVVNITISLSSDDVTTLPANSQYVCLVVNAQSQETPFHHMTKLLIDYQPGYIFIQTDKPIYTPGQKVKIRIIPIDEELRAVDEEVRVDIVNPDNVTVSRSRKRSNGAFIVETLNIPDYPVYGNYTVTASYINVQTASSVRFEIMKYVLPKFKATFEIEDGYKVILPYQSSFRAKIKARYVFGKPVRGHVTLFYGLVWHGHIFNLGKQRNLRFSDQGETDIIIHIDKLRTALETMWFPNDGRLLLKATVTEEASGKVEYSISQDVVFARSLYRIKFERCSKFFKPGLLYLIDIDVIKANGEPASNVPMVIEGRGYVKEKLTKLAPVLKSSRQLETNLRGSLTAEFLLPPEIKTLTINVRADITTHLAMNQTESIFVAVPYYSPSDTYMSVRALSTKSDKTEEMPLVGDFMAVESTYTSSTLLKNMNMLVLSKGKIIRQSRTKALSDQRTDFFIPVTTEMTPSARVLTFSVRESTAGSEVVADSTWINIQECCEDEISVLFGSGEDTYRPSVDTKLTISGKPNSTIGLLAVDESVYTLKKNTLTRAMFFEKMKSHDRGCGYSGGESSAHVFERAGLVVLTNANMKTKIRSPVGCTDERDRQTRSAVLLKELCCKKGYERPYPDATNCLHIATLLKNETNSMCAKEFYHCCRYSGHGFESSRARLYRPADFDDEEDLMLNKIPLRTNFPESWLFKEIRLGKTGTKEVDVRLPDSITTWMINAVSASKDYGFCISKAKAVNVFKPFFVQLDLPYSAVRLEQLEVRATIFNYLTRRLSVKLFMQSVSGICYSGESGENSEMTNVDIPPNDAVSVAFPVIPLELGLFPIRVYVYSVGERDAVEKLLYVEGEGLEKIHTVSVMLDPTGKRLSRDKLTNVTIDVKNEVDQVGSRQRVHLDLDLPTNVVPHTEKCTVSAIGDILGPTVSVVINGINNLLKLPTGCGEQNLIHLAPNVYVMQYLRATRRLLPDVEKKARAFISQGLTKQLTFRKSDGSFATWPHADSSTWLTAFTLKVLIQAGSFVPIDTNVTCGAFLWLLERQRSDGSFQEDSWVLHKEMQGGTAGEITLTAFVLIAMLESDCKPNDGKYKLRSIEYIESKFEKLDRPLAVAMATYALALLYSPAKHKANEMLQGMAQKSTEGFVFWGPRQQDHFTSGSNSRWLRKVPNAIAVETTAYALLAQLELGEMQYSNKIVGWILQQRESHGSFVSTQDTVIGLQALAEYSIRTYSTILDMTCHITSEADKNFLKRISLKHEDALVLKSVPKVPIGGMLMFEAAGTGVGLMQVEVRYNVPTEASACMFDIIVDSKYLSNMVLQFFDQNSRSTCELCSQSCGEKTTDHEDDIDAFTFPSVIPRIQNPKFHEDHNTEINPGPRVGRPLNELNSSYNTRYKRSISSRVLCLEVCVRFKGNVETGMAIIDVGLFTGYQPIDGDLNTMKVNGKIDHYENSKRSVLLYVSEISHKQTECFKFRAKQKHIVENIQPAIIRVYDYYDPGVRCTSFYKMNNVSGNLANFCDKQKGICKCLEGRCSRCEEFWHGTRWTDLMKYACHNSSYVFQIKVLDKQSESAGIERVLAVVKQLIYSDGDFAVVKNSKLILLKRSSCSCPSFEIDNNYFLMTSNPKRFKDDEDNIVYAFLMDKLVVVAKMYKGKNKDIDREKRHMKRQFRRFQKRLIRKGCSGQRKKGLMLHSFSDA